MKTKCAWEAAWKQCDFRALLFPFWRGKKADFFSFMSWLNTVMCPVWRRGIHSSSCDMCRAALCAHFQAFGDSQTHLSYAAPVMGKSCPGAEGLAAPVLWLLQVWSLFTSIWSWGLSCFWQPCLWMESDCTAEGKIYFFSYIYVVLAVCLI